MLSIDRGESHNVISPGMLAMENDVKVVELFAGVGGFRLGLEGWHGKSASSGYRADLASPYRVVWSNQWEPSTKKQHASLVYAQRFGPGSHSNEDISQVEVSAIPDHDLLVGGFPCQDYSVATTLKRSKGLIGKRGVLWWSIHRILSEKRHKPKYLFLENVDRLLISPSGQRGRDFAIILQCLNGLGYAAEWRVINAADYGMPQRRRRVFILAYLNGTSIHDRLRGAPAREWILGAGTLAAAFPVSAQRAVRPSELMLNGDIATISSSFNATGAAARFENAGVMVNGRVTTLRTHPAYSEKFATLGDVIQHGGVGSEFDIAPGDLAHWIYLKGAKKVMRINAQGLEYQYSEGGLTFPDPLDKPSRTIVTGEGGSSPSRFKHVIRTPNGYRRLSPVELERLNMFPDNHTRLEGVSDAQRAYLMGNAIVVGVVERIGVALYQKITGSMAAGPVAPKASPGIC